MFDYEEIKCRKKVVALKFHIRDNLNHKKPPKPTQPALPESQKLLEQTNTDDECKNEKDIADIKRRFHHNYKGELVDKFVRKMIEKKGSKHVHQCLTEFGKYIDGQDIRNVAGLFYTFVIDGLVKPVSHKAKVSQRDNFDQREYSDEYLESFYANLQDDSESK